MQKKKIAILGTRGVPARYGGFETFAERLATGLVRPGYEVTVYCPISKDRPMPKDFQGVRLVYLSHWNLGPLTTVFYDLLCLCHACFSRGVVYMLGYGSSLFCFLPRLFDSEVWINMDGNEWARAKWGTFAKFYFKLTEAVAVRVANRVIVDSQAHQQFLLTRHRNIPAVFIPYGADVIEEKPGAAALSEWRLEPNGYFLVVARLEPENHIREIIQGFLDSGSQRPIVIVGDHRSPGIYVKKLLSRGDPRARFIGAVYEPEKLKALRYYALAYIHGHSVGGTNPSLLEAMGCGNVVIAHDNSYNREVTEDSAFYFSSPAELSTAIKKTEAGDFGRMDAQRKMPEIVKRKYNWQSIIDQYAALLSGNRSRR